MTTISTEALSQVTGGGNCAVFSDSAAMLRREAAMYPANHPRLVELEKEANIKKALGASCERLNGLWLTSP